MPSHETRETKNVSDHFQSQYKSGEWKKIPFDTMGWFTFCRTYSRTIDPTQVHGKKETWQQTLNRLFHGFNKQLGITFTPDQEKEFYSLLHNLKCSVAGRFLWQLGTRTVDNAGLMSLQNCAFMTLDRPIEPFAWAMQFLMFGSGVGYKICPEDVVKLPPAKHVTITRKDVKDADFIVPDSREGWVYLFRRVLRAHFFTGKSFSYSCMLLRSKGAPIKGFGGVASGPEILDEGMQMISEVLNKAAQSETSKLTTVNALDVMNIIGKIVVSGNVRRCIPRGAHVHTQGGLVEIQDVAVGDNVLTSKGYRKVLRTFDQGVQKLCTIVTRDGDFDCTLNHRMAVVTSHTEYKWVEAGKLKKGDCLVSPSVSIQGVTTHLPESKNITVPTLDVDMAWFIGVLYTANTKRINNGLMIMFKNSEQEKHNKAHKQLTRFKNKDGSELKIHKTFNGPTVTKYNSTEFMKYMDILTPCGVPKYILQATQPIKLAFVQGLCDTHKFCTSNSRLVRDIQHICYSCGIQSVRTEHGISIYPNNNNSSDWYPVPVNKVVSSVYISKPTYDIEVEGDHEFYCNGLLTHNSAQIALGDCKDKAFLHAKRWDIHDIPTYRCYSNNSVICNDIKDIVDNKDFWEGYNGNGEPYGLININLHRKCGRIGETQYPDKKVEGINPCAEQSLESGETCCLSEIFLPNITSLNELKKCAKYLYIVCKHSLTLSCPESKQTEDIVHRNMRMGIGVTGFCQATKEQKSWLSPTYEYLRKLDNDYSKKHNFPRSIKLSTVKPSGTLSILGGTTSGVNPGYSKYYIRRVRISTDNYLVKIAKKYKYNIEFKKNMDGSVDYDVSIVSFPIQLPDHTILAENCSAVKQLEMVKEMQTTWSDNAVSNTILYKKKELPEIKAWLIANYNDYIKSVSFLLHSGHGFAQAPFEPITKEQYEALVKQCIPVDHPEEWVNGGEEIDAFVGDGECKSGICPVR